MLFMVSGGSRRPCTQGTGYKQQKRLAAIYAIAGYTAE